MMRMTAKRRRVVQPWKLAERRLARAEAAESGFMAKVVPWISP
jgi:hypothetical protein